MENSEFEQTGFNQEPSESYLGKKYDKIVKLATKFNDPTLVSDYILKQTSEEEEKQRIIKELENKDDEYSYIKLRTIKSLDNVSHNTNFIRYYIPKEVKSDRDVEKLAIKKGMQLKHIEEELRDDEEIVLLALANTFFIDDLQYASERLRDNEAFMIQAINVMQGSFLRYLLEESANKDIKQESFLKHVSKRLQKNKEFAMKVINMTHGPFTYYLAEELRDDEEIVFAAMRKAGIGEMGNASGRLREDKDFFEQAKNMTEGSFANYIIVHGLLTEDKNQREGILETVRDHFVHYIPEELKKDRNYMMEIAKKNFHNLRYFPSEFVCWDSDFMLSIIKDIPQAVQYAPYELKKYIRAVLDVRGFL